MGAADGVPPLHVLLRRVGGVHLLVRLLRDAAAAPASSPTGHLAPPAASTGTGAGHGGGRRRGVRSPARPRLDLERGVRGGRVREGPPAAAAPPNRPPWGARARDPGRGAGRGGGPGAGAGEGGRADARRANGVERVAAVNGGARNGNGGGAHAAAGAEARKKAEEAEAKRKAEEAEARRKKEEEARDAELAAYYQEQWANEEDGGGEGGAPAVTSETAPLYGESGLRCGVTENPGWGEFVLLHFSVALRSDGYDIMVI